MRCISDLLLLAMPQNLWLGVDSDPSEFLVLLWRVVKVQLGLFFSATHDLPQVVFTIRANSPRVLDSSDCIDNCRTHHVGWKGSAKFLLFIGRLTVIISTVLVIVILHYNVGLFAIWLYNIIIKNKNQNGGQNRILYMLTEMAFELLKNSFNLRQSNFCMSILLVGGLVI